MQMDFAVSDTGESTIFAIRFRILSDESENSISRIVSSRRSTAARPMAFVSCRKVVSCGPKVREGRIPLYPAQLKSPGAEMPRSRRIRSALMAE